MSLVERQKQFLEAAQKYFGTPKSIKPRELFGVSNGAKILEGGIQIGVANLDAVREDTDGMIFGCVLKFPPEDEVYFAVLVRKDKNSLLSRLKRMKDLGVAAKSRAAAVDSSSTSSSIEDEDEAGDSEFKYSHRNNLVPIYLAADGRLWLRNSGFWNSLKIDLSPFGPAIDPDEIVVALYPPAASARRSLLAREFIGWLGNLVGTEKTHELAVWSDVASLSESMRRLPSSISIEEIENSINHLGGHYPNGEVGRFHAALNFLETKHFVILSGLSGTGKTQLALKYARAVHGVDQSGADDPLLFVCPVRPEWTDPSGLTGYHDVLSNRYVVPPFLEAVLVALAHRESPVFVILDEMNLARVEYYFSDILSAIETGRTLQLHSNSVPLEGTTGTSIRAEVPLPPNLFIIGTINIDETTNPISDKVLDRATVIDMSEVDAAGFITSLVGRYPTLQAAANSTGSKLLEVHRIMQESGQGFGYRLLEESLRYHAYVDIHMHSSSSKVTDDLLVQKVFVKLRGSERHRSLLNALEKVCEGLPRSTQYLRRLKDDLDEFGSFQAMR